MRGEKITKPLFMTSRREKEEGWVQRQSVRGEVRVKTSERRKKKVKSCFVFSISILEECYRGRACENRSPFYKANSKYWQNFGFLASLNKKAQI